jgi:hypothetical protein
MDGGEADLFGSFSPYGRPCTPMLLAMSAITESETTIEVVTPVLQILCELLEKDREPNSPMSMVRLKVDLPHASEMPLAPAPSLPEPAFVERGGLDVVAPHSPKPTRREVSLDEEVGLSSVLAQVPGALFARKLCDFLINLEADDPGSARRLVASWMRGRSGTETRRRDLVS